MIDPQQPTGTLESRSDSKEVTDKRDEQPSEAVVSMARRWTSRVKAAKRHWETEYKRMKDDMAFAYGNQWPGQTNLHDDRYVANIVLREVNQKVSTLYARDPKAIARRRKRLDFELWDGKIETLMMMAQRAMATAGQDIEAMATIQDYENGHRWREMVDRVCRTLEVVYEYQWHSQRPGFKVQMKQLVRRVITCGVAYVVLGFERDYDNTLCSSETHSGLSERAKRAAALAEKIEKGEVDGSSADNEQLKMLLQSLQVSMQDPMTTGRMIEHLKFDFPPATSVIPDEKCRCLKGFVGCDWVAREFLLPLDYVNAMFETDISATGGVVTYDAAGMESTGKTDTSDEAKTTRVMLWDIQDLTTKSRLIVCDGHKDYVLDPEALEPNLSRFWTIFPLTFNDVEFEPGVKGSPFPPSDVTLMRSPQMERNRSRETLRDHRIAKLPRACYPAGMIDEDDLANIQKGDNSLVGIKNLPPNTDINKVIVPLNYPAIDIAVYDTRHVDEDIQQTTGAQAANLGPAKPDVTATVGTIAEQSRMTTASSNVDDLDDLLSELAEAGGEVLLQEMSPETVKRIAGRGAVWPSQNREDFLNEIYLDVVAASAGRPNKAIEVANGERLIPLLLQAGANPQAVIREAVKRLDDQLEPDEFFPIPLPALAGPPGPPGGSSAAKPQIPGGPSPTGQEAPMPLPTAS